jgi:hypothetical protein
MRGDGENCESTAGKSYQSRARGALCVFATRRSNEPSEQSFWSSSSTPPQHPRFLVAWVSSGLRGRDLQLDRILQNLIGMRCCLSARASPLEAASGEVDRLETGHERGESH